MLTSKPPAQLLEGCQAPFIPWQAAEVGLPHQRLPNLQCKWPNLISCTGSWTESRPSVAAHMVVQLAVLGWYASHHKLVAVYVASKVCIALHATALSDAASTHCAGLACMSLCYKPDQLVL